MLKLVDPEDWEDDIVFCDYQGGYAKLVGTTLMRPLMIGIRKFQLSPRLDNFTPQTQLIITQSNSQRGVKFCTIDDWCLFDDYLDLGCACLGNAKIPLIVVRYSNYRQPMLMLTQPRSNTNIFSDNSKITWYYGFLNVHSESDPLKTTTQVYQ